MRLALVCVLVVLVAGCAGQTVAPPTASIPETLTPSIDDERRANLAAYRDDYVPQAELRSRTRQQWIVIVRASVVSAGSLEDADAAARRVAPDARHRFIFQIGEEGDVDWPMGGCELPHVLGTRFLALLERDDVTIRFSTKSPSIRWREGDRIEELTRPADDLRMHVRPEVGPPGAPGRATTSYCVSSGFGGFATMSGESAAGLELWEIPGTAHIVDGIFQNGDCRRARARVHWPNTPLDFAVPVAIWPE